MSIITQEEAEQIKVVLEKTFETEAYITSSMDGTIKFIHANVRRTINKIDTQNLSIISRDYDLTGYGAGIHVRFENNLS